MLTVPSVYLIATELSKKELLLLQDKINNDLEEMETTKEVFKKIAEKETNGPAISHKSGKKELEAYFNEILPD